MKNYCSPRALLAEVDQLLAKNVPNPHHSPLEDVVEILHDGRYYFWIGIYLVVGNQVVRQVFRGPVPPCHTFAFGKGNVGTAGQSGITKVIADVSQDSTYSMCFVETKSEVVVPIKLGQRVLGVIDVESDKLNAFGAEDRVLLKQVAERLAKFLVARGKYLVREARERAQERPAETPQRGHQPASEKALETMRAAVGQSPRR